MLIKKIFLFSFIFGVSIFFSLQTNAFSISPLKYTISLDPNDSKDLVVTVKNDSNINKEYVAVVAGVQQDDLGRSVIKSNSDIAESWIKYQNKKIVLAGGKAGELIFTINIPKNVPPGAHYIAIGAQEKSESNVGSQLMTMVVLQVAGTAKESLIIEKFVPTKNYFFNDEFKYLLQLKNIGNVDLSLNGKLQIYNFKNNVVNTSPINLGNKLFAQSNRTAQISPYLENKFLLPGYYRSMLVVDYGLTKQQVIGSVDFWYLPVWSFYLLFGLLLILFFVIKKNNHEKLG